jgi:hypothetical protein
MQAVRRATRKRTARRRNVQREAREQTYLFNWARRQAKRFPGIEWMHASLNGAYLQGDATQRARRWGMLKAEGALDGVSDVFLPVARRGYHGLYIEMKAAAPARSQVSSKQKRFIDGMREQGYRAEVAHGWAEARALIVDYYGE